MKIFIVWLLMLHDTTGTHIVTGLAHEDACRITADELNARAGSKRELHWTCDKQAIER